MKTFKEYLNESSLSRVNDRLHKEDCWMIISAYRADKRAKDVTKIDSKSVDAPNPEIPVEDKKELQRNAQLTKKMGQDALSKGYSFIRIVGSYKEDGVGVAQEEVSLLVFPYKADSNNVDYDAFFNWGINWCRKAEQDGLTYFKRNEKFGLFDQHGKEYLKFQTKGINKLSPEFYSRIRGDTHNNFVFEDAEFKYTDGGSISNIREHHAFFDRRNT